MKGWSSSEKSDEKLKEVTNQAQNWILYIIQYPKHAYKFSNEFEIEN